MRTLTIVLLCAAAFGQPNPARVSGRVVDQNGDPIRRATMKLLGVKPYSQVSDDTGGFTIDNVTPGSYSLVAQRPGYSTQKYGAPAPLVRDCPEAEQTGLNDLGNSIVQQCIARAAGTTVVLAVGQELSNVTVKVFQQSTISGRLTSQDGDALQNWAILAMRVAYPRGVRELQEAGRTNSGPDGTYVVANLPPGRYYLRAGIGGGLLRELPGKQALEADLQTFYPNQADDTRAMALDLKPGDQLHGIDIQARHLRVYAVRGSVSGPQTNEELSDQILALTAKNANGSVVRTFGVRVRMDATFEIRDVEPGTYTLGSGGIIANRGVDRLFGQQEITITNADVEGVKLTLGAGADVTGTVTFEGNTPAVLPYIALSELGTDPTRGVGAQVDPKGSFRIGRKLAPTKFVVTFQRGLSGVYVKSMRFGNQDVLHDPLDLSRGGGSIDIVLSSKVVSISGSASAGLVVSAWPKIPQAAGGLKVATADQNGHFEMSDLGPGDYFVAAWEEIDAGLLQSASFLAHFQGEAATVTVEEGGRATADVKVIPRQRVASEVEKLP